MSSIAKASVRLGTRLIAALQDCARWTRNGNPCYWKPKSMEKLAEYGLVEKREDPTGTGYFVTERGFAVIEGRE